MGNPQIAEALFSAHAARATGWLTCSSGGRESRLGFRDGQLVQVDLRFGFQAPAQALVQAGRIGLFQLDALWARGEAGAVEAETLEELGVTLQDAEAARALASVKQVLQLADSARFEAGQVDGEGLLSSARVVRAAWETLPIPNGEAPWFRLRAPDALDGWDVTAEEREWLQDSSELRSAEGVVPQLRALLEVLAKGGAVEWIPAEEIRRREAEEQARREAEEQARREAEEQARREAEEQARREAEEQARREAEEQARREAEEQARREAEEQARREAEEQARREAEEQARREAEEQARREAEEQARREAEEQARREAEEQARREAEEQARREAEEQARREAEEQARREAEEQARREAEEQARRAAEAQELREAQDRARREAEERVRREAEQALRETEEQARREAEEQARREAEEQVRRAAEEQAREAEETARREAEAQAEERAAREAQQRDAEEAALREVQAARLRAEEDARREEEERLQREAQLRAEEEARREAEEASIEAARLRSEQLRREAEEAARAEAEQAARLRAEEEAALAAREAIRLQAEESARRVAEEAAREQAEAAARLAAEEDARRQAEEAARAAAAEEEAWAREEAELLAKAQAARRAREEDETRRAAEEQRLADERRREEEEEAELLRRAEAARVAQLRAEADRLAQSAREGPTHVGPPPPAGAPAAPERAKSLLDRMNEALRQSALGVRPTPIPLTNADALPARNRDEGTDPHYHVPPGYQDPQLPRRPLVLGGQGRPGEEADLWNIVQPASPQAAPPTSVQSFEEALRRVDSSLEALVGEPGVPGGGSEPLVEPIIEGEVESPPPLASDAARLEDFDVGDPSDPAEAARLRRQRLLRRAMENLGAIQQPQAPRIEGAQVVAPPPEPSPSAPPPPAPSSPSGQRSVPTPTAGEQQLASQIEARFEALKLKDHFATLGLSPSATREQVKTAFLSLAKVFHPDRLPPSLPHLAQKMSGVFEAIRNAYEVLHDDTRRAAYANRGGQAAQSSAPAPSQQAADLMKMAEVFFKKRDYRQAEQHFQKAHALDKGGHSLAAAAWSIYMDPARKAEGGEARTLMQKALAIDPDCDRAHYQLGVIARVEGDMESAERHFREAVRVNPRHLEANQEIRLIEMRQKKKDSGKKGGGFFR